jgi:hypothetical protein
MKREHRYSSCDYLAAMGLAATLAMQAPLLRSLPLWILAILQRDATER